MAYADPADEAACQRRAYERDPEAYKRRAREHTKRQRALLRRLIDELKSVPCADCEREFPPICMDFDHIGNDKDRAVSDLVRAACSVERLMAEVAKCEVVCACCHRIRTAARLTLAD